MAVWPGGLPATPLIDGYNEAEPDNRVRTEMAVGPPKMRRRATAGIRQFAIKLNLSKAQVETLSAFYRSTLSDGVLAFDFTHPRLGTTVSMRFAERPRYDVVDPQVGWRASFVLELLS